MDIFLEEHGHILLKDFTNYINPQHVYERTDEICVLECVISPH